VDCGTPDGEPCPYGCPHSVADVLPPVPALEREPTDAELAEMWGDDAYERSSGK
jgi:hypothetical protein